MNASQAELLQDAEESLAAARLLLENLYLGYAASRAYFAMFYVAEAFLEGEGLSYNRHSAVIAAFGKMYARTRRVPPEYHRYLIEGQALRQSGDYGERNAVTRDEAELQIQRAQDFVELGKRLL